MRIKTLLALACTAALFGCESEEEQRARIEANLPADCVMIDLGSYRKLDVVIVIRCANETTTNIEYSRYNPATKVTDHYSGAFYLGGANK